MNIDADDLVDDMCSGDEHKRCRFAEPCLDVDAWRAMSTPRKHYTDIPHDQRPQCQPLYAEMFSEWVGNSTENQKALYQFILEINDDSLVAHKAHALLRKFACDNTRPPSMTGAEYLDLAGFPRVRFRGFEA